MHLCNTWRSQANVCLLLNNRTSDQRRLRAIAVSENAAKPVANCARSLLDLQFSRVFRGLQTKTRLKPENTPAHDQMKKCQVVKYAKRTNRSKQPKLTQLQPEVRFFGPTDSLRIPRDASFSRSTPDMRQRNTSGKHPASRSRWPRFWPPNAAQTSPKTWPCCLKASSARSWP